MIITHKNRIIVAGLMGNLVEAYDLTIGGLLSIYLAKYLVHNTSTALLIVWSTFFAGFLARPLGALFIGLFSDLYGRKIVLAASILTMGITTSLIGFIPSQNSIGIWAIILLLLLRILQSFSCGAEYLNSFAYLVECAENKAKGYAGSWASFGAMAGLLLASIAALQITNINRSYPELEWLTWRIPFILALAGSSIGLYIRLYIPESRDYVLYYSDHPRPSFKHLVLESTQYMNRNKIKSMYVFVLSALGVSSTFLIYIYAPIQAHICSSFTDHQMLVSNIISLSVMLCIFPIIGKLSDRIARINIVLVASAGIFILSQPFFYILSYGNFKSLVFIQSIISIPAAAYYATVPVILAEMFPIQLRCTVLSALYSIAASLAAGLIPLVSLCLLRMTHISTSPSWIILILVILFLILFFLYKKMEKQNTPNLLLIKAETYELHG